MNKRKQKVIGQPPKNAAEQPNRKAIALSELKSAGLLLNKLSKHDVHDDASGLSWIPSTNNKENVSSNRREIVDHIPKPAHMAFTAQELKKKPEKKPEQKVEKKNALVVVTSIASASYDENWALKQANSFTDWMNFTFSSSLESPALTSEDAVLTSSTGNIEGNANGLKTLLQKRGEAINRQKCFQLYHSDDVVNALRSMEEEVCEGRLLLREDRDILADLGLQEELFALLFSYEMPWIRLGLEIVFGEIISVQKNNSNTNYVTSAAAYPCKSNCPKWKNAIKTFVLERLLTNEDLTAQYTKQQLLTVSHQKKLKTQIRQHMMKKFLSLVYLLDTAKKNVILLLPTLFVRNAPVKSSKDIILTFCREIMRGEGDVIRHLSLLGYTVSFAQSFIDEFDYTVKNLAVDLRDGVRLARLMELLTHTSGLSESLRVPAVSRLQKLHNVGLVLKKLYDSNSEDHTQEAKNIVDGNRDRTLFLLWQILYGFELKMLINPSKVLGEAMVVAGSEGWRRSVYGAEEVLGFAVSVPIKGSDGSVSYPKIKSSVDLAKPADPDAVVLTTSLLRWCDAIAGQYGVPVHNLTSCLADGRALCLLIHYYHPTILPTKMIQNTVPSLSSPLSMDNEDSELEIFTEATSLAGGILSKSEMKKGLEGERKNFATLRRACHAIGGIPLMLPSYDSTNLPEEKTMTLFLGYLFARMIESSSQVRAAIRIQRFFRGVKSGSYTIEKNENLSKSVKALTLSSMRMNSTMNKSMKMNVSVAISQSHAERIESDRIEEERIALLAAETEVAAIAAAQAAADAAEILLKEQEEEARVEHEREEQERAHAAESLRVLLEEEAERVAVSEAQALAVAQAEALAVLILEAKEEAERVELLRIEAEAEAIEAQRIVEDERARVVALAAIALRIKQEEEAKAIRIKEEAITLAATIAATAAAAVIAAAAADVSRIEALRVQEEEAIARIEALRIREEKVAAAEAESARVQLEMKEEAARVLQAQMEMKEEAARVLQAHLHALREAKEEADRVEVLRLESVEIARLAAVAEVEAAKLATEAADTLRMEQEEVARVAAVAAAVAAALLLQEQEEMARLAAVAADQLRREQEEAAAEALRAAERVLEAQRLKEEEEEARRIQEEKEEEGEREAQRIQEEAWRIQKEEEAEEQRIQQEEEEEAQRIQDEEDEAEALRVEEEEYNRAEEIRVNEAIEMLRLEDEVLEFYRVQAEEQRRELQRIQEEEKYAEIVRMQLIEDERRIARERMEEDWRIQQQKEEERRVQKEIEIEERRMEKERKEQEEIEIARLRREELASLKIAHDLEIERLGREAETIRIAQELCIAQERIKTEQEESLRESLRVENLFKESQRVEAAALAAVQAEAAAVLAAEMLQLERENAERLRLEAEADRIASEAESLERYFSLLEKEEKDSQDRQRREDELAAQLAAAAEEQSNMLLMREEHNREMLRQAAQAAADAERRFEEAARREEELIVAAEQRRVDDEETAELTRLNQEKLALEMREAHERAVAEMRVAVEMEWKVKYEKEKQDEKDAARMVAEIIALRLAEEERETASVRCRSATQIQSMWRMALARSLKFRQLYCAIVLQATMRGFRARNNLRRSHYAAVAIQSEWRKKSCIMKYKSQSSSKNSIENENKKAILLQYKNILENYASRKITIFFRNVFKDILQDKLRITASISIQRFFKAYLPLLRVRVLVRGLKKLQPCFHAYLVRKTSSAPVVSALTRIRSANLRALADPSQRLGNQLNVALQALSRHLSPAGDITKHLRASMTLKLSTELSSKCRETFSKTGANIMFKLIKACTRSAEHQELLENLLVVMLNVTRDRVLAGAMADTMVLEDAAEVLITVMQMFRDRNCIRIFEKASNLLNNLRVGSEAIERICSSVAYQGRMSKILHIIEMRNRVAAMLHR